MDYGRLPQTISGWRVATADEWYERSNLHEYINGGAELYLTYDFQRVFARRYIKEGAAEIVLEIYDMGSPADAYGVFTSERQDESCGIGADSEYGGGLLRFWQDRYFVAILAIGDESEAKPVIMELGRQTAALMPASVEKPELVQRLPQQNLQPLGVRFFHTHTILNRQYFLANDNILLLGRETDCALAPYQDGDAKAYLLLIQYPQASAADSAYSNFLQHYLPEAQQVGIAELENHTYVGIKKQQNLLAIVFEAATSEQAKNLLARVFAI